MTREYYRKKNMHVRARKFLRENDGEKLADCRDVAAVLVAPVPLPGADDGDEVVVADGATMLAVDACAPFKPIIISAFICVQSHY